MKKVMSLVLACIMLFMSMSTGFCAFAQDYPYIDENGYYHRQVAGDTGTVVNQDFDTDFDRVVDSVRTSLKRRSEKISFDFATPDSNYSYVHNSTNEAESATAAAKKLAEDILTDVFRKNRLGRQNAGNGDYLLKQIYNYGITAAQDYTDSDGEVDGKRYYLHSVTMQFQYYGYNEWDEELLSFAQLFERNYLNDSMSEYEKVKTIYDFIVRNTEYDTAVFGGEFKFDTYRYQLAHSAYGAIYGTVIKEDRRNAEGGLQYFATTKTVVSGEKIIESADQGLAVCEGFSRLFCYLCNYFGIDCHIVDGDYVSESGKESDPHEWNYVYLDDGTGDGYLWYQVDTTFAENKSYKEVDVNNYDYFLRGTKTTTHFGTMNHQQPYHYGLSPLFDDKLNNERPQLYTWDDANCVPSERDYRFSKANISGVENISQSVIVKRIADYGGDIGVVTTYIYYNGAETKKIEVDVDKNGIPSVEAHNADGFIYNGQTSIYTPIIAYLVPDGMEYDTATIEAKDADNYDIEVKGAGNSSYTASFKIVPLDMSTVNNYGVRDISETATYQGMGLSPSVLEINDGYNDLVLGEDFDLVYYDSTGKKVDSPEALGKYTIDIVFKGNHSGIYETGFEVQKIKLSELNKSDTVSLPYYPKYILEQNGISGAHDYITTYNAYHVDLKKDKDYTATSVGNMDYTEGSTPSGQIILTGIESSDSLTFGGAAYSRKINYIINEKFNISETGLTIADNAANHTYTGSAVVPSSFNVLDEVLERNKDYKITGYENNVNAGTAYVNIQGINGCTGSLKLQYRIAPASITDAAASVNVKNGKVSFSFTYNGKTLVNGTDYTVSGPVSSGGKDVYTISGKGNFNGTSNINIVKQGSSQSGSQGGGSSGGNGSSSKSNSGSTVVIKKQANVDTTKNPTDIIFTRATLKKLKRGKKSLTVKWAKQSGIVHGYHIQYSTSKKFKKAKTKTVKGGAKTSLKIKKLKKKKKYYVRVRAYYTKGNKTYCSAWSKAKSAKTK